MSKKNTFISYVPYFIGGFIIAMVMLNFEYISSLAFLAPVMNIIGLAAALVFAGLGITGYYRIKNHAGNRSDNTDEDAHEQYMYKKYADTSLYIQTGLVLSILVMGVAIIQQMPVWIFIVSAITMIVTLIFLILLPTLVSIMYPERDLPSPSDSKYADKLLAASDEGERHVILEGLYKTYNTMNSVLFIGLVLLMIYSIFTGDNQTFGMVIIAATLIISNAQYVLSIRNRG